MITYQVESIVDILEEADPLAVAQWEELKYHPLKQEKLNIDYNALANLEHIGFFIAMTARDDGKLVGYLSVLASEMIHHQGVVMAAEDAMYVDDAYRKQGVAENLIKAIILKCKEGNITYFSMSTTPSLDYSPLLERNGFTRTEVTYTRKI